MHFYPSLRCRFGKVFPFAVAIVLVPILGSVAFDCSVYGQVSLSAAAPWQLPRGPQPGGYVPATARGAVGRNMAQYEPADAAMGMDMEYEEAAGWEAGGAPDHSWHGGQADRGGCGGCGAGGAGCGYADACGWGADCGFDPWGGVGYGYNPCLDRLYVRAEYLMWWGKSATLPPLASTSLAGTAFEQSGVLELPTTRVLVGGERLDPGIRSGGRFSLGWWFSPCRVWGLEATYLFLGTGTDSFRLDSQEHPILARPFFNAATFAQDSVVLAYPGRRTGWFRADLSNQLDSVEVLLRRAGTPQCRGQLDFLVGYRYARLAERLSVESSSTFIATQELVPFGTTIDVSDRFDAHNEFHGAQLGFTAITRYCYWSLELTAKLGVGGTWSRMTVDGDTIVTVPPLAPVAHSGGMLALPTNMGIQERTGFSVLPELGVTVSRDLTCRLRATFGYTFLYWSQVARPGEQVDTDLNPTQFPPGELVGFPAPKSRFLLTDYWAQGLHFGLDYRF
jgi:hypothetical protein